MTHAFADAVPRDGGSGAGAGNDPVDGDGGGTMPHGGCGTGRGLSGLRGRGGIGLNQGGGRIVGRAQGRRVGNRGREGWGGAEIRDALVWWMWRRIGEEIG